MGKQSFNKRQQIHGRISIDRTIVIAVVIVASVAGIYAALIGRDTAPATEEEQYILTEEDKALIQVLNDEAVPTQAEGTGLSDEFTPEEPLSGSIVYSGRFINSTSSIALYSLDTAAASATPELVPAIAKVTSLAEYMDENNPQNGFFTSAVSKYSYALEDGFGIHFVDPVEQTLTYITSASSTRERYLEWSQEAQLLAFSRLTDSYKKSVDTVQVKNWETVVVDTQKDEVVKVIAGAVQPKWSPDGTTLIYIKNDGLYSYNLESEAETKITGATDDAGQFLTTAMIDVTGEGTHLVWTIPGNGLIVVYEITSWAPFTLAEIGRVEESNVQFFWPVFSPDGNYYVVQAVNDPVSGSVGRAEPRFEVRPTLGKNVIYTYPLDGYDFNTFFTDSWITSE